MIALIAIVVMAVLVGIAVGLIALILAIVKAIVQMARRSGPPVIASSSQAAITGTQEDEREFARIVALEWPSN